MILPLLQCSTGVEEGLLPHYYCSDNLDEVEQERRLLYVAMTRAREAGTNSTRANACQEGGLLAGKTVLLVTNAMQFLSSKHIDRIVVMRPPGGQMQRSSDVPVTVDGIAIVGSDGGTSGDGCSGQVTTEVMV